jgi:hypothetical protein
MYVCKLDAASLLPFTSFQNAEMAAREMGGLSLADALLLCELLKKKLGTRATPRRSHQRICMANTDPAGYERAALRWLQRFIDERLPPLTEVVLAASAASRCSSPGAGLRTPSPFRGTPNSVGPCTVDRGVAGEEESAASHLYPRASIPAGPS